MTGRRVAVVTGGGGGIGAAVARRLGAAGIGVVVADLGAALDGSGADESTAARVASRIVADGGDALAVRADVADHDDAGQLLATAIDHFGRLDVLVNAAGILRDRMIFNLSPDDWDAVIAVHLRGTYNTTHHAARYWRSHREEGAQRRLINVTSTSGLHGAPGQPNYAAAKMGVVGFTYSCANALSRYDVTANAVSPAAVTRMTDSAGEPGWTFDSLERDDELSPENVAPAVAYLAGPDSGWLTGRIIHVQGYSVSLYSDPERIAEVRSPGPWTDDTVAAAMEDRFRPLLDLNRTSDLK